MTRPVRANRWQDLGPLPSLPRDVRLSVIIPVRDPSVALARTVAALESQSLDPGRFEVIVVDDGSEDPVEIPGPEIDLRVVRQETDGRFGAGRARNTGARAASGGVLLFLDADVVAGHTVLERALRWFAAAPYAVLTGVLDFADFDGLDASAVGRFVRAGELGSHLDPGPGQTWREVHFARTHDLTVEVPDMFRVTIGALLGVGRELYELAGGFRELGLRGIEDVETGYRLQNTGGLMVLDRELQAWHQGRRFFDSRSAAKAKRDREPAMRDLLPLPAFRPDDHPEIPSVPRILATLDATDLEAESVERHVRAFGACPRRDVALMIEGVSVREADPRVHEAGTPGLSPVDLAAVPVRVNLTGEWLPGPDSFERLDDLVTSSGVGVVHVMGHDGDAATAASARALGRAHLVGAVDRVRCAEELFGVRWVTNRAVGFRPA
ncbi:MAG: glycosyltransferase family 2 protein [Acidimicrobiales bacterium]